MPSLRRWGLAAAIAVLGDAALAYRFATVYRQRAGFPPRHEPLSTPGDVGLGYDDVTIDAPSLKLPGWFVPAREGRPGPGVVLVHGWESCRDRMLPNIQFLNAAGFHCLTFDVRGHGMNPAEELPLTAGEFGADSLAAFEALVARAEVTRGGIVGHSMGGVGAILAAATDRRVAALVSISAPSDPRLLVRQTFVIANLPIPGLVAHPLAWYASRMYLRPRGHSVRSTSAKEGVARYCGPLLIVHGEDDEVMPAVPHARALADAARRARRHSEPDAAPVELHIVRGGGHGGLYEDVDFRRVVAGFLAEALGGPFSREEAADRAASVDLTSAAEADATAPSPAGATGHSEAEATGHSAALEPQSTASARLRLP